MGVLTFYIPSDTYRRLSLLSVRAQTIINVLYNRGNFRTRMVRKSWLLWRSMKSLIYSLEFLCERKKRIQVRVQEKKVRRYSVLSGNEDSHLLGSRNITYSLGVRSGMVPEVRMYIKKTKIVLKERKRNWEEFQLLKTMELSVEQIFFV